MRAFGSVFGIVCAVLIAMPAQAAIVGAPASLTPAKIEQEIVDWIGPLSIAVRLGTADVDDADLVISSDLDSEPSPAMSDRLILVLQTSGVLKVTSPASPAPLRAWPPAGLVKIEMTEAGRALADSADAHFAHFTLGDFQVFKIFDAVQYPQTGHDYVVVHVMGGIVPRAVFREAVGPQDPLAERVLFDYDLQSKQWKVVASDVANVATRSYYTHDVATLLGFEEDTSAN